MHVIATMARKIIIERNELAYSPWKHKVRFLWNLDVMSFRALKKFFSFIKVSRLGQFNERLDDPNPW